MQTFRMNFPFEATGSCRKLFVKVLQSPQTLRGKVSSFDHEDFFVQYFNGLVCGPGEVSNPAESDCAWCETQQNNILFLL
jgi:hypothetical protein